MLNLNLLLNKISKNEFNKQLIQEIIFSLPIIKNRFNVSLLTAILVNLTENGDEKFNVQQNWLLEKEGDQSGYNSHLINNVVMIYFTIYYLSFDRKLKISDPSLSPDEFLDSIIDGILHPSSFLPRYNVTKHTTMITNQRDYISNKSKSVQILAGIINCLDNSSKPIPSHLKDAYAKCLSDAMHSSYTNNSSDNNINISKISLVVSLTRTISIFPKEHDLPYKLYSYLLLDIFYATLTTMISNTVSKQPDFINRILSILNLPLITSTTALTIRASLSVETINYSLNILDKHAYDIQNIFYYSTIVDKDVNHSVQEKLKPNVFSILSILEAIVDVLLILPQNSLSSKISFLFYNRKNEKNESFHVKTSKLILQILDKVYFLLIPLGASTPGSFHIFDYISQSACDALLFSFKNNMVPLADKNNPISSFISSFIPLVHHDILMFPNVVSPKALFLINLSEILLPTYAGQNPNLESTLMDISQKYLESNDKIYRESSHSYVITVLQFPKQLGSFTNNKPQLTPISTSEEIYLSIKLNLSLLRDYIPVLGKTYSEYLLSTDQYILGCKSCMATAAFIDKTDLIKFQPQLPFTAQNNNNNNNSSLMDTDAKPTATNYVLKELFKLVALNNKAKKPKFSATENFNNSVKVSQTKKAHDSTHIGCIQGIVKCLVFIDDGNTIKNVLDTILELVDYSDATEKLIIHQTIEGVLTTELDIRYTPLAVNWNYRSNL